MSWFSAVVKSWFTKDNVKRLLILGREILMMVVGQVGDKLSDIAKEEILKAEKSGLTGKEKAKAAFNGIKARLPEVGDKAINLAIEIAVNALT